MPLMRLLLFPHLWAASVSLHKGDPTVITTSRDMSRAYYDGNVSYLDDSARISVNQRSELQNGGTELRVVLFVTTADSCADHMQFLDCYPKLIGKQLQKADVIMHASVEELGDETEGVASRAHSIYEEKLQSWTAGKKTVYFYKNRGKQRGAMKAVHDGFSNGWFEGYDWVIRINPDVIIYNEARLFSLMAMPSVSAVLVACCGPEFETSSEPVPENTGSCNRNTDFFAVRPDKLSRDAWKNFSHYRSAEIQAQRVFRPIRRDNAYAMLTQPSMKFCRTHGGGVWHAQGRTCEDVLNDPPWYADDIMR